MLYEEKTKENYKRVESICDKDTCAFICEKVQFFGLRKINFQTFFAN